MSNVVDDFAGVAVWTHTASCSHIPIRPFTCSKPLEFLTTFPVISWDYRSHHSNNRDKLQSHKHLPQSVCWSLDPLVLCRFNISSFSSRFDHQTFPLHLSIFLPLVRHLPLCLFSLSISVPFLCHIHFSCLPLFGSLPRFPDFFLINVCHLFPSKIFFSLVPVSSRWMAGLENKIKTTTWKCDYLLSMFLFLCYFYLVVLKRGWWWCMHNEGRQWAGVGGDKQQLNFTPEIFFESKPVNQS